jgi:hypothetical protein
MPALVETFTCALCHRQFATDRPDAEARAEQHALFPGVADEDCAVVCDDCFERMGFGAAPAGRC